ncbi:MAG: hypothetical protein QOH63_2173 [Acidobacteriota bacterium]|jgi:hypothetical protein|nr:hypothetical protein [Acidobacteriota bacterium]
MGVLIICPETNKEIVRNAVTHEAPLNWERDGVINVLSIPDRHSNNAEYITAKVNELLPAESLTHIIVLGNIQVNTTKLRNPFTLQNSPGTRTFERRTLPQTLQSLGQDWLSQLDYKLRNGWHHGHIDRDYLEKWVYQFERCSSHGWVGKKLLRILEFWSDSRIREALRITKEGLEGFDCVSVNRHRYAGKSADAIASLVQKQLDSNQFNGINPRVLDFRDAIQDDGIKTILFVEDCLITGNEMVRVLTALMDQPDVFGNSKAEPLDNPDLIREKEITLRFAVVTNGGVAYLNQFLNKHGLANIQIELEGVEQIKTLTADGLTRIENDNLYDEEGCVIELEQHVIRSSFQPVEIWGSAEKAERALNFCAEIGRQLYRLYINKKGKLMSDKKLDEASLGIRGMALALAFSHSVPKETLPLFWMGGDIEWDSNKIQWFPLFQSGE